MPKTRRGALMGASIFSAMEPRYPLTFEIKDGPSFHRIADAAKYYHDKDVDIPLTFTGVLTDTTTGQARTVKLKADAYGFWSGTNFNQGEVVIYLSFRRFFMRFGPTLTYNFRTKTAEKIEFSAKSNPSRRKR